MDTVASTEPKMVAVISPKNPTVMKIHAEGCRAVSKFSKVWRQDPPPFSYEDSDAAEFTNMDGSGSGYKIEKESCVNDAIHLAAYNARQAAKDGCK